QAKVSAYLETDLARRDVLPSPEESVTTTYYKPEQSILADAELPELEEVVFAAASTFLEGRLGLPARQLEIERAWINEFEPGAQEGQHTHDGSLLSCSYYVEAPDDCGCIVFPDPIGERRGYRQFTRTVGSGLLTRPEIAVEPKPGRLVMFESWFGHSVQCNKSGKRRVSIAINLREAQAQARSSAVVAGAAGGGADTDAAGTEAGGTKAAAATEAGTESSGIEAAATVRGPAGAAGKPYLFNELFDVEMNLHLNVKPIQKQIPTVVIDEVLKHPERVRDVIGSMPAANWKHEAGGRNFADYYDCRLRVPIRFPTSLVSVAQKAIQQIYRLGTRPADASIDVNWFMQIKDKRGDFAVPHSDMTERAQRSFTCIVYLNGRDECSGGTAFFRFRKSGSLIIDEAYANAVKADSRIAETGLDYWPERADELWERVGTVDMVPGRMLIFPSEFFHAAWHPKDSFFEFPRLTLAFWMVC
ncbi:MAG TPA: TIGR02466 family protein, partial [Gammaproteobacteria bacterium]|nr:TIGR02466 family protein [Gammaproteobacteria bacterium]